MVCTIQVGSKTVLYIMHTVSWLVSGVAGIFLRYRYGAVLTDLPGRYVRKYCSRIMVNRELADPRRRHPSQALLDKAFSQQTKEWKDEDPAPKPEHAVPNSTVKLLASTYGASARIKFTIIAVLVVVAYFFLLRVCMQWQDAPC